MANFTIEDEGIWFFFDDTDHSQGGVKIRLLTPLEEDAIDRKVTKISQKPHRGMMMEHRKVNSILRNELLYTKWIVDWKGIVLDGETLECNHKNIMLLMNKVSAFARFVLDKILDLGDDSSVLEEARVKNSENSSNGE